MESEMSCSDSNSIIHRALLLLISKQSEDLRAYEARMSEVTDEAGIFLEFILINYRKHFIDYVDAKKHNLTDKQFADLMEYIGLTTAP